MLPGDQLYEPLWAAVWTLELCGFKVLGLMCNGLAADRWLFCLDLENKSQVHKVYNLFATDDGYLYFLVDPPYLLKTVR